MRMESPALRRFTLLGCLAWVACSPQPSREGEGARPSQWRAAITSEQEVVASLPEGAPLPELSPPAGAGGPAVPPWEPAPFRGAESPAPGLSPMAAPAAAASPGAVELSANVLRGTARITNTNPEILALLRSDPWRNNFGASAQSYAPGGYSSTAYTFEDTSPLGFSFEMLVEAGAGGEAGVSYSVYASRGTIGFPTQYATVKPRSLQPEPTEVSLEACTGVVQFQFGTDETCEERSPILQGSSLPMSVFESGPQQYTGYVPAGSNWKGPLYYYVQGTDSRGGPITLVVRREVEWSVGCDQVARVCVPVEPAVAAKDGDFTGPWQISGEPTRGSEVNASHATWPLHRRAVIPQDMPEADPGEWWKLLRASEGLWNFSSSAWLRGGRELTWLQLPGISSHPVVTDAVTPLTKEVDGELRHAYLMRPSHFYGSVRLANPTAAERPGRFNTLRTLHFNADFDANGDGWPDSTGWHTTYVTAASSGGGRSSTSFPGGFDLSTGELGSTYEQVLVSPFDEPRWWAQEGLLLAFWSERDLNFHTRPGLYDPERYRYGLQGNSPRQGNARLMAPEQRHRVDHEYCYNEVSLYYAASLGRLFNPRVDLSGGFEGVDWRGHSVSYSSGGWFYGTPAILGGDWVTDGRAMAQPGGTVSLTLPQGSFSLTPSATLVADSGAISVANFQPVQLTLGCGQDVRIVPPLAVTLSAPPGCASASTLPVSGVVGSGPAVVDRVWYQLNGGPEVTLCTDCGREPSFSFTVPLEACGNDIQVFAFTEGMEKPAGSSIQIVWDDPADGPSCGGSTCVNRPPQARCTDITVRTGESCEGCGSVDDGSYDPDEGDTLSCVQTPDCPYTVGTQRVRLTCTDSRGLSSWCEASVTVKDEVAPVITCPGEVPEQVCREGGAPVSYETSAQDNCGAVTTTCYPGSGATFPPGTTQAQCTAIDASGNQARCFFPVTVVDDEPPTLECPASITAECNGRGLATLPEPPLVAQDSCQPPLIDGPRSFPVGSTTGVTYTAADTAGHQVSCTTTVTAVDTQAPTLTLQGSSVHALACGQPFVEPGYVARDACHGSLTSQVAVSGSVDSWTPGTYSLSYEVEDPLGHRASATRQVRVSPRAVDGLQATWTDAGHLLPHRLLHTATRLADGRVLVTGGFAASAEVYDPATNGWSQTGRPGTTRRSHTATLLADGRVLVTGGASGAPDTSAEVYDPATGAWSATGSMRVARREHTATPLADGRVLVVGGGSALAELYDPALGTFQATGSLSVARVQHTATLLPGGRVLVTGGLSPNGGPLASAEVYDVATGTWSAVGTMTAARRQHTALLLMDGRVLLAGGARDAAASSAELYDVAAGTFSATGAMASPRRMHGAALLPSGSALVLGGYDDLTGINSTAELYEPCGGTWGSTTSMRVSRYQPAVVQLADGQVLVLGGFSTADQTSVERYHLPVQ
ncbi:kelch repeat-containing protein [Archangium violaceum]|uniref:kelch repeat-containing protein n=1 Tax=Archangium violaceum TaxID=83451 RepID=UPI000696C03C|nr:kelch repeat-containing protein [Archangium violaceum]